VIWIDREIDTVESTIVIEEVIEIRIVIMTAAIVIMTVIVITTGIAIMTGIENVTDAMIAHHPVMTAETEIVIVTHGHTTVAIVNDPTMTTNDLVKIASDTAGIVTVAKTCTKNLNQMHQSTTMIIAIVDPECQLVGVVGGMIACLTT
jgi:S-formylglutathione hydrolase FrmB